MQIPDYLRNEHFDDRYFDVVNAVEEARLIYIQGSRLAEVLSERQHTRQPFTIGETGFGAGRLLLTLIDFLKQSTFSALDIRYYSVELFPVSAERMRAILNIFRPMVGGTIDELVSHYALLDVTKQGWQQTIISGSFGTLTLNLWIGEALEMVNRLPIACDAWFLDGHGPKKNPQIWRPALLEAVGAQTVVGGTVATYTVAGHVRRALSHAGFQVERVPGFGGKKSVLRGSKVRTVEEDPADISPKKTPAELVQNFEQDKPERTYYCRS